MLQTITWRVAYTPPPPPQFGYIPTSGADKVKWVCDKNAILINKLSAQILIAIKARRAAIGTYLVQI